MRDIVSVGEDGTAVLKWTKPGESFVGTHTIKAEFDCGEFNTWESRYNTPAPASLTFEISKAAPPAEDKPDNSTSQKTPTSQTNQAARALPPDVTIFRQRSDQAGSGEGKNQQQHRYSHGNCQQYGQ